MNDLGKRLSDCLSGTDCLLSLSEIPKIGARPRIAEWNDEVLVKLREKIKFGRQSNFRGDISQILIRFYNFYLAGTIAPEDTLVGVVADACLLAEVDTTAIWGEDTSTGSSIYPFINTSKENLIAAGSLRAFLQLVYPETTVSKQDQAAYRALTADHTNDTSKEFRAHIETVLSSIRGDQARLKPEIALCKLTGYLALTLWRAATKNESQLMNAFLKTQYKLNLITLTKWPAENPFSPPCRVCVSKCVAGLRQSLPTTSMFFTVLAYTFVQSKRAETNVTRKICDYLSEAVLTCTAKNGLGIIKMLDQVCTITKKSWTDIRRLSSFNVTDEAWKLIENFFETYLQKESPQYGFNWARIINDGYLRGYSPKDNEMFYLAGVFAGIIEMAQGPGIWQAEWAKGRLDRLEEMKRIGYAIYKDTKSDN